METILYVTDFSKNAEMAFKYALSLSKKTKAELIVAHVYDIPTIMNSKVDGATFLDIETGVVKLYKTKLQDFCKAQFDGDAAKHNIRCEVREGKSSVDGIVDLAHEFKAKLLVMGTKGESALREIMMGSTSKGVIAKAKCPVLTIPSEAIYKESGQIVYASDFDVADIEAIKSLLPLAEIFNTEIIVAHVSTNDEYAGDIQMKLFKEKLKRRVPSERVQFKLLLSDNVFQRLNDYLLVNDVLLVGMLEHGKKSFFEKLFHRDLVLRMEIHSRIPLLSFNTINLDAISVSGNSHENKNN